MAENFSTYYPPKTETEREEIHQNFMKLKTADTIDELIDTILEILNIWENRYA